MSFVMENLHQNCVSLYLNILSLIYSEGFCHANIHLFIRSVSHVAREARKC